MLLYIVWGVQKTQNLAKEYTYRVRTLIWPFYFNLDHYSDSIIRSLEQNGRLLNKSDILFLMISLDLMKSSEVRKAGD